MNMADPSPPFSIIRAIVRWFVDLAKMPGRIRVLADGAKAARDQRFPCPNCADGRLQNLTADIPGYSDTPLGTCSGCGAKFFIDLQEGKLLWPYKGGR